jgi:hypothetical protein
MDINKKNMSKLKPVRSVVSEGGPHSSKCLCQEGKNLSAETLGSTGVLYPTGTYELYEQLDERLEKIGK